MNSGYCERHELTFEEWFCPSCDAEIAAANERQRRWDDALRAERERLWERARRRAARKS